MRVGELEAQRGAGVSLATAVAERFRTLVLEGPDGEGRAAALATAAETAVTAGNVESLYALVKSPALA
jgi:hypothetical protein